MRCVDCGRPASFVYLGSSLCGPCFNQAKTKVKTRKKLREERDRERGHDVRTGMS